MARINTSQNRRIIKREERSKRPRLDAFKVGKVPSQRRPSIIESPTSAVQYPTTVSIPSVQQGLSSSVHEERATNIGSSMGRESPRSLASTTVLHGEVMREYGENELLGFSLDQSSLFIKIISLLNGKVFETFRNMENGFITLQKVWSLAKYHINKTEHGYSQHFTNKSEFPAADTEIEDELKRNIVCVQQSIRCAYPGCMCKGKIYTSRNAAQQHLQNLNVIYFCAACGQNFNARTTAVSHHRTNCSILKNEGLEYVKMLKLMEKKLKKTNQKLSDDEKYIYDDDSTQDAAAEMNYSDFESPISFDEFLKYCLQLGIARKVLEPETTIESIKQKTSLEEKYILLSFLKTFQDLVLDQRNLKIKPTSKDYKIFYSKKYAFQIVERLSATPISQWDLDWITGKSLRKLEIDEQIDRFYCIYPICPCGGKFYSITFHDIIRHIQIRNFTLVCLVCHRAFNNQKQLDEHYTPDCELPLAMQPETLKNEYLAAYRKKNNL